MNILQRKKGAQQRQDLQRVQVSRVALLQTKICIWTAARTNAPLPQELYQELVSKTPKCIGTYMLEKTIGQGSFGKIKLAIHALTGHQQVALKVIDKTHAHAVVREVEHWRRLNHPHIVRLYELLTTESKIYLAMEYAARGDLLLWVNKVGRPTLGDTRKWFRQTADAVAYLHRRNLVHRDLKLENILLDEQLDVKLIDFGFTREFDQRRMLESYCGSMAYAAPEMISGQRYSGPEADIWSLGVILFTLLCGRLPFDEDDPMQTNRKIVLGEYTIPDDIDPEAASLIKAMLQVRAKDRADIERILAHPWL
ncbi:kinase-like domain-containing protein, partial [Syncephalis pseudoplumigaleata]